MFNGSGVFNPPPLPEYPPSPNEVISSAYFIQVMQDVFNGLSLCVTKDGQQTITANIPFSGFGITGARNGINPQDYATMAQSATLLASSAEGGGGDAIYNVDKIIPGMLSIRAFTAATKAKSCRVNSYNNTTLQQAPTAAAGVFVNLGNASGLADDGGTRIQDTIGNIWQRLTFGQIWADWWGAIPDASPTAGTGTNNDAAFNAAWAYARAKVGGGAIQFGVGDYGVTQPDFSSAAAIFSQGMEVRGQGNWASSLVLLGTAQAGILLLGTNQTTLRDFAIFGPNQNQCAIYCSRNTTSVNANANRLINVYIAGNFTKAPIVWVGAEDSYWDNVYLTNSNASAFLPNLCAYFSSTNSLIGVAPAGGAGGTPLDGSNTANTGINCEFYAPVLASRPVLFDWGADWSFFGGAVLGGNGSKCATYRAQSTSGLFNGPVNWYGTHFEWNFSSGSTADACAHYLVSNGIPGTIFNIGIHGGLYSAPDPAVIMDFDRTNILEQPELESCTIEGIRTNAANVLSTFYINTIQQPINFTPKGNDGKLIYFGSISGGPVVATFPIGLVAQGTLLETFANALPTTGTYATGQLIINQPSTVGAPRGWQCTAGGSMDTLGAITASGAASQNHVIFNSAVGLYEGLRFVIGVQGPFTLRKLVGTDGWLDANLASLASGAACASWNASLTPLPHLVPAEQAYSVNGGSALGVGATAFVAGGSVTLTGARPGMAVVGALSKPAAPLTAVVIIAHVTANDTIAYSFYNPSNTGTTIPASTTITFKLI